MATMQNGKVVLKNLVDGTRVEDSLHKKAYKKNDTCDAYCGGAIYQPESTMNDTTPSSSEDVKREAAEFLDELYDYDNGKELNEEHRANRIIEVMDEIDRTGSYTQNMQELQFASTTAWRNASRCIGRFQWKNLKVFDARNVQSTDAMFECIKHHLSYATNNGKLRSTCTVFPQRIHGRRDFRVWNSQILAYACYQQSDGTLLGDPSSLEFTQICHLFGWKGNNTAFDTLPLILETPADGPRLYELPSELVMRVKITHPEYDSLKDLCLEWYTTPLISNMSLDCGGVVYTAIPFNGWYVTSEIARDLCDANRYNCNKNVAKALNLDMSNPLWIDKAYMEVTAAILFSFQTAGVTITDHHSVTHAFMRHYEYEFRERGGCPSDWVWLTPPISSSLCPVFHQEMINYKLKPSYDYQIDAWKSYDWSDVRGGETIRKKLKSIAILVLACTSIYRKIKSRRVKCVVLYGTETGRSFDLAKRLSRLFNEVFNVEMYSMDAFGIEKTLNHRLAVIICSTFGIGEPPSNAQNFTDDMKALLKCNSKQSTVLKYGVFALGSSLYKESFCEFGHYIDQSIRILGAQQIVGCGEGDELANLEAEFVKWSREVFNAGTRMFGLKSAGTEYTTANIEEYSTSWNQHDFRCVPATDNPLSINEQLQIVYGKEVFSATVTQKWNLQPANSRYKAIHLTIQIHSVVDICAGDHIVIYPTNRATAVNDMCDFVSKDFDSDTPFIVESTSDVAARCQRIPTCSLRHALQNFLDIQGLIPCNKLKHLLIDESAQNRVSTYKKTFCQNLIGDLKLAGAENIRADALLVEMPLLQPRYYTISNSTSLHSHEVHITATLADYEVKCMNSESHIQRGVCSAYMDAIQEGDVIPISLRSNPSFHLTDDASAPLILIGAGSGIAGLRALWQERCYRNGAIQPGKIGDCILFYGCRSTDFDYLYEEEIDNMVKQGIITSVHIAESRNPNTNRKYVQDVVVEYGEKVRDLITSGAHIYVCGGNEMGQGVRDALGTIFSKYMLVSESVKEVVHQLKESKRYHEDTFGTTKTINRH